MNQLKYERIQALRGDFEIMADHGIEKPNFSALAEVYGMDRHTVKKYWEKGGYVGRKQRGSYLDEFEDEIREKVKTVSVTKTALFRFYQKKYPSVFTSYSTFAHWMNDKEILNKKALVAHVRYETPPGKQLQVDWKENLKTILKSGEVIEYNIMSATFGYSRKHIFVFSVGKGMNDFFRCILTILKRAGGMPEEILTDNMSAICNHHTGKLYPEVIQFGNDLGIKIKRCRPKTPETKGKDESANRFVNWLKPYDNELSGIEELIETISEIEKDCNTKTNSTTGLPPDLLFKKEMESLKPLPNKALMDSYIHQIETQVVPSTLLVRYRGSEYSVPPKFIGKQINIVPSDTELYLYHSTTLICVHEITESGRINYREEDYIAGLKQRLPDDVSETSVEEQARQNLALLGSMKERD